MSDYLPNEMGHRETEFTGDKSIEITDGHEPAHELESVMNVGLFVVLVLKSVTAQPA